MKKQFVLFLLVALLIALISSSAFAADIPVTSYDELVAAIAAAPAGTQTTIVMQNGFTATGNAITIAVGQDIVINGLNNVAYPFVQTTVNQRHFTVYGTLTLQNVTLSGYDNTVISGGINVPGGQLIMETGSQISMCRSGYGGAVYVTNQGSFIMYDGVINNNIASWSGGGVLVDGGTFTMATANGQIIHNTASSSGGGVEIRSGSFMLNNGTINDNTVTSAVGVGGGVEIRTNSVFTMITGLIADNTAPYGGGLHVDTTSLLTINAGTISYNTALLNGGAIFTSANDYRNPLHANAYPNLIIGPGVNFYGNIAGNGARRPPSNPEITRIATNSSSIFNNAINNFDINYYAAGTFVTEFMVTFNAGSHGTFGDDTTTNQMPVLTTYNPRLLPIPPGILPTVIADTGYVFIGWFQDSNNVLLSTTSYDVTSTVILDNTTFTAQYAPLITVNFNAQGGTPVFQSVYGVAPGNTYSTALTAITTPPTLSGNNFLGWFTSEIGGTRILATTIITQTVEHTLYAQWTTSPSITVTFNAGFGSPFSQVVYGVIIGDTYAGAFDAIIEPTRNFYTFGGWFTGSSGSGTEVTAATTVTQLTNQTLYAYWIPYPSITVTFDAPGSTEPIQTVPGVNVDSYATYAYVLPYITTPIMNDYTFFSGWFTEPIGGILITPSLNLVQTTNHTLYAQWTSMPPVTITFDAQGGTPNTQQVPNVSIGDTYSSTFATITTPTRGQDTFLGWFTEPSGGDQITADMLVTNATDHTLYAQWNVFTPSGSSGGSGRPSTTAITVTFDAQGGTPDTQIQRVYVGYTYTNAFAAITEPSLEGYIFLGWFTEPHDGVRITADTTIILSVNHTLYAHWREEQTPDIDDSLTLTNIHFAYLIGESNNRINPTGEVTRAQVATVLLRILSDDSRAAFWTLNNPFPDVPNNGGAWYSNAVSVINNTGLMTGRPNGFTPNAPITRAEVATILVRFLADDVEFSGTTDLFPDTADSWARDAINLAGQMNWIQGDNNGYFNPEANITRAEFATIINRMLQLTRNDIVQTYTWADNANQHAWYYWALQIASNYAPNAPQRNWPALQKPDARPEHVFLIP